MAIELPSIICSEIEDQCKSRSIEAEVVMPAVAGIIMNDITQFVDIERMYILKIVQDKKESDVTYKKITDYIMYSLALSHKLIKGKPRHDDDLTSHSFRHFIQQDWI